MKMDRWLRGLAFALVAGCGSAPVAPEVARQAAVGKVDVCHVPDGASAGNIITIAEPAYDSHIAHGDPAAYTVNPDGSCQPGPQCGVLNEYCDGLHPCCSGLWCADIGCRNLPQSCAGNLEICNPAIAQPCCSPFDTCVPVFSDPNAGLCRTI